MAALAALFLLERGKRAQAREWLPYLRGASGAFPGFLGPYVNAELVKDVAERRRLHATASRRVSTPEHLEAIRRQTKRFRQAPGGGKKAREAGRPEP